MPGTSGVRFEVECPSIMPGQRIGVCGSSETLGAWDPNRCLELVTNDEPPSLWVAPRAVELDLSTKYKFVVLSPGSNVRWEDGDDHALPPEVHSHGRVLLSSVFNSQRQSVQPDNSPLAEVLGVKADPAEEIAQPSIDASKEKFAVEAPGLDVEAVAHLGEPEGERSPSLRGRSSAGLQPERKDELPPLVPLPDVREAGEAGAPCASEPVAPSPPVKGAAPVGDEAEETLSAEGAQKAETHEPPPAADVPPTLEDDGLVQSSGVWRKQDHTSLSASVNALAQLISASLGALVGRTPGRQARLAAAGAAAGGVALGASGAVTGLAMGSLVGAACGVLPAVVTFGLSVPIGATLGGGAGLGLGVALGTTAGAAGGGMAGYGLAKWTEGKVEP